MNGKAVFPGGNAQSLNDVAGQPIAEYVHTKSGTVHKLEGPENAKNIIFESAGDYNDGDTWTLNNKPVTVTYNGGEELLPTAVLIGDMLQSVVMGNQLRLMLQKPTPQESLLRNGDWESGIINQRAKDEYTNGGHTIDGWHVNKAQGMKLKVLKGKISIENLVEIPSAAVWAPSQDIESAEKFQGEILTVAAVIDRADDNWYLFIRAGGDDNTYILGLSQKVKTGLNTISFTVPAGTKFIKCGLFTSNQPAGKSVEVRKIKLEPGKRFTGWPAWDYGAELAKCQRYAEPQAWQLAYGYAQSKSEITISSNYFFKVKKRVIPIFEINENKTPTVTNLNTNQNISGCTFGQPSAKNKYMFSPRILNSNNTFEVGTLYRIIIPDTTYFISADI